MNKTLIIKLLILCLVSIKAHALEKVVLFGDSLMAGYGLPAEQHLSVVLQDSLQKDGYKIQIINGSVSGSTSSAGLGRAEWTLAEPNIDLMILGLGANDMLRGINPNETEKNLEGIIAIARERKIKLIIAGMLAPTSHGSSYKKNFDNIYPALAKKHNAPLIPFLLEGVALKSELNQADGIHPNAQGTIVISNILKKSIIDFIKQN
ncbi:MAG: arylesterase [Proteobacteria bacterium]|nr:arylesterase [Pseudomonadota bacterium]